MFSPAALVALSLSASAHKPTFSDDFGGPDRAFQVADPDVSIVVYQDITCEIDQLWMTLDAEPGYAVYVQLGVPVIERLEGYRPSVALLAPGLDAPDEDLPFDVPEGMGALVFHSDDVDVPDEFYEPFTQTESWVVVEETVELPEGGPAWLVAWDPAGWTGKLWLATGTIEDFSDVETTDFLYWSEAVNEYHETGRFTRVEPREEVECDPAEPAAAAGNGAVEPTGCAVAPVGGGFGLALLALLGRRRE